ncbi:MAG: peptidylprolyl isomerase [Zoogloeaceae bacterium]|jgi:peptidyl-prolyl cis-trans isomerase SurA|nr:peptidylprolyl isomerase [Zoogloeaceae bacterium]
MPIFFSLFLRALGIFFFAAAACFSLSAMARPEPIEVDRIIAVVGNEAITLSELKYELRSALNRLRRQGTPLPPEEELERQMLERLILERAQQQLAKEYGMKIDDAQLDQGIARVAANNHMSLAEFKTALEKDGVPFAVFREEIRKDMLISRLRDREVDSRIVITDAEIDNYLAQRGEQPETFRIAHILVRAPESAAPAQLQKLKSKAESVRQRALKGENFAELAAAYSDASDALQGGNLEARPLEALPALFAEIVVKMKNGDVSPVLQSANGFHVFRLIERRDESKETPDTGVRQTHARHILMRVDEVVSEAEARRRLSDLRERLLHGESFAEMARLYSQDGSAANGGDLGWLNPGDTVPEFERVMDALADGELSDVVQSPFGFHLIRVEARRLEDMSLEKKRLAARQALRERKLEDAYQDWLRQLLDKTYVEYRLEDE